jgi:hypothetical protein
MHNIWLQQLRKRNTCLYITTSDDYILAFKQSTLYKQYLQGGPSSHGRDRNELLLKRARGPNDLARLTATMANYTSGSSFTNFLLHLEGEKVFGSSKRPVDYPLSVNNDSKFFKNLYTRIFKIMVVKRFIVGTNIEFNDLLFKAF